MTLIIQKILPAIAMAVHVALAAPAAEAAEPGKIAIVAAENFYGDIASQARDKYGNLLSQAREGADRAQDVVRHNPGQSVAAAFGVGIVVGVVVGLALRSR